MNETDDKKPVTYLEAVGAVAAVIGLVIAINTLLKVFLPSDLIPAGLALASGLVLTVVIVWRYRHEDRWIPVLAALAWIVIVLAFIIFFLIVSQPVTILGSVVNGSNHPTDRARVDLIDSSGVSHVVSTNENGAFKITNIPDGKFTVSVNSQPYFTGRVPSGWKRMFVHPHQVTVSSLIYEPPPTP